MPEKTLDIGLINPSSLLRNLSSQDFLDFGIEEVAYVRPVQIEDKTAYAIHAADGTPLSVMDSENEAISAVQHNDLKAATLH